MNLPGVHFTGENGALHLGSKLPGKHLGNAVGTGRYVVGDRSQFGSTEFGWHATVFVVFSLLKSVVMNTDSVVGGERVVASTRGSNGTLHLGSRASQEGTVIGTVVVVSVGGVDGALH